MNTQVSLKPRLDSNLYQKNLIKVFLLCSGLGQIKRGYESFTQECFEALSQEPSLDITLFKGGGESSQKEISLWNLPRYAPLTIKINYFIEKITARGPYFLEQLTFFLSLLPHLYFKKPDVILFSDENLGNLLWYWRRLTKQNYKLLFSNGGPILPPFPRWDYVQQVAPTHFKTALNVGQPAEKQSLVPYGIHMLPEPQILTPDEREALRHKLGLPEKQPLVLSVGAIDKSHKRMDYVIHELARLPEPRPYLLLLGQQDAESAEIFQIGKRLLGNEHFQIKTIDHSEMSDYYRTADAFVLASLYEGFGRVFLEAMSYGLPCLAHDYEVSRFILGEEGYLANFEVTGSLANLIPQALAESHEESKRYLRYRTTYERFSWDKLRPNYVNLIQQCINL